MGSEWMKRGEILLFSLSFISSLIILFIFSPIDMLSFLAGIFLLLINYYIFKWFFLTGWKKWFISLFFLFKFGLNLFSIFLALKFLKKIFFIAGILTFPFFLAFSFLILYFISYEWKGTRNASRTSPLS